MEKQLLFTITSKDFKVVFYKAGVGAGGQKVNKTSSACRITHILSGAVGDCKTHRQQIQNKKEAFQRLIKSKEFNNWLRLQSAAVLQGYQNIEKKLDDDMKPENIKTEVLVDGKWMVEKPL